MPRRRAGDPRPAAGRRLDLDMTPDGGEPVGEVGEAGARSGRGRVESRAVVLDGEPRPAVHLAETHADAGATAGVLGGVLQAFDAAEVDGRLDGLGLAR